MARSKFPSKWKPPSFFAIFESDQPGTDCVIDVQAYTFAHQSSILKMRNEHVYPLAPEPRALKMDFLKNVHSLTQALHADKAENLSSLWCQSYLFFYFPW